MASLALIVSGTDMLKKNGFHYHEYSDDPRDVDYRLETDDYVITVDPWFDVKLTRKDFDHIDIKIEVDDEYDLKELIEFCKGE